MKEQLMFTYNRQNYTISEGELTKLIQATEAQNEQFLHIIMKKYSPPIFSKLFHTKIF